MIKKGCEEVYETDQSDGKFFKRWGGLVAAIGAVDFLQSQVTHTSIFHLIPQENFTNPTLLYDMVLMGIGGFAYTFGNKLTTRTRFLELNEPTHGESLDEDKISEKLDEVTYVFDTIVGKYSLKPGKVEVSDYDMMLLERCLMHTFSIGFQPTTSDTYIDINLLDKSTDLTHKIAAYMSERVKYSPISVFYFDKPILD